MTEVKWIEQAVKLCVKAFSETKLEKQFNELDFEYKKLTQKEKENIHRIFKQEFEVNDGIYILSVLVRNLNYREFWLDVVEYILKGNFECLTRAMLEIQVQMEDKVSYSVMRKIHKLSVDCFKKTMKYDYIWIPREKRNEKRIVIMTEQLMGMRHAPTHMVLEYAYVLQTVFNYEVRVYGCNSNLILPKTLWLKTTGYRGMDKGIFEVQYKGTVISCRNFPMRDTNIEGYEEMVKEIYEWNPLLVFNMGIVNPVADVLCQFTTVAAMDMTIRCPVSEAQILLREGRSLADLEQEYERMLEDRQKQLFLDKTFPAVINRSKTIYERKQFGLPDNKFIVAIVGNRLNTEIDEKFATIMKEILRENEKIVYAIIGKADNTRIYFQEEYTNNRIYYLGYCEDLYGIYGMVDLYLNPERIGGGFSAAMALEVGIPVVTLPDCDVAYYAKKQFCVSGEDEMKRIVCRYAQDPFFYKKKKEQIQEILIENPEQEMINYVERLMEQIKESL